MGSDARSREATAGYFQPPIRRKDSVNAMPPSEQVTSDCFPCEHAKNPGALFHLSLHSHSQACPLDQKLYQTIGAPSHTLTCSVAPGPDFMLNTVRILGSNSSDTWDPLGYAFEGWMINGVFRPSNFWQRVCAVRSQLRPCEAGLGECARSLELSQRRPPSKRPFHLSATFQYYPK